MKGLVFAWTNENIKNFSQQTTSSPPPWISSALWMDNRLEINGKVGMLKTECNDLIILSEIFKTVQRQYIYFFFLFFTSSTSFYMILFVNSEFDGWDRGNKRLGMLGRGPSLCQTHKCFPIKAPIVQLPGQQLAII